MRAEDTELLKLARNGHWLIGRSELRQVGMSSTQWIDRVTSGAWVPVFPGVWRHAATPETFELRVRAGARWLGPGAALGGAAAAVWWGLDGFEAEGTAVEFLVPRHRRNQFGDLARTTRDWRSADLLRHRGVRVTSVTRVVMDLAAHGAPVRQIESAIDSGIRLRRTSVPTLAARVAESGGRGRTGVPLLRELMLDSGGESSLERRFLRLLRAHRLPRPVTQATYAREEGRAMRVDFEFPRDGLVVEVSGRLGHTSDHDRQRESRRRNALTKAGKRFIEFATADVIDDPVYVVATIRHELG